MTPEILNHIKQSLEGCDSQQERTILIKELCDLYRVTSGTIWRWANKAGLSVRKERSDKGKSEMSDAELKIIAARLLVSKQVNGNFTNSVKNVLEELEREGFSFPVGYERICTLMRERGLAKQDLARRTPHVRLKSAHPNHVWQFDVTNCLQWHLDNKTGLGERDLELEFYKNKVVKNAKKIKRELLRFVIVDHCTGAMFFWYYYSPGERAMDGADFFFKAFSGKQPLLKEYLGIDSTRWQMHGVPKILMSDKGSILKQKAVRNLMGEEDADGNIIGGLGVKIELHAAGNPQAKGKVERLMRTIGTKFETILKIRRPSNLEELNQWALRWCINYNESFMSKGKKHSPADYWLRITEEQLRICPQEHVYRMLIRRPSVPRTVDGSGHFPFENREYYVPDSNATRQKVLVSVNAYEYPAVDVHYNGYVWLCKPLSYDAYDNPVSPADVEFGTYRQPLHTENQRLTNELEEIATTAWGVGFKGNKQKRQSTAPVLGKEKVDPVPVVKTEEKVVHFQKQGKPISTPYTHAPETKEFVNPFTINPPVPEERVISTAELIKRLVAELGEITVEQNKIIKARWSKGITLTEADRIINNIEEVFVMEVKHA